jgi:hypothetical protein
MRLILRAAACCAAVLFVLSVPAAAEGRVDERASLAIEATSLAYGLAAGSPRIALSANVPLSGPWSIQASPAAAWGGEAGARYLELDLPAALRASLRLGPCIGFAAAGIQLGWARTDSIPSRFGLGPIVEAGARAELFGRRAVVEPYLGAAASSGAAKPLVPAVYGGLRLGYAF